MNLRTFFPDTKLFLLCLTATLMGIVAIWDAGYARTDGSAFPREVKYQAVYVVVAMAVGFACTRIKPGRWKWLGWIGLAVSVAALCVVEFTPLGYSIGGAQRWIKIGSVTIQPSEFIKLASLMFLSSVMAAHEPWKPPKKAFTNFGQRIDRLWIPKFRRSFPFLLVVALAIMVERQPDLATGAVILVTSLVVITVAGVTRRSLLTLAAIFVVLAGIAIVEQPYRFERFRVHADRWSADNRLDGGFQTVVSEAALARGGVLGVGVGNGTAKQSLPAPTTDFVLTTVGEEFGLIGVCSVLVVLGGITLRLLQLAAKANDRFGRLVLSGLATWIGVQTSTSVMMVNGALPPIGIPLPFISYGGSSLVALWMGIGIAMTMVARKETDKEVPNAETGSYGWRDRRPRVSRT